MTLDDQLAAFLGETPKQSRADLFSAEVMKTVERRVFVDRLWACAAGAAAIAMVLWACAPVLDLAVSRLAPSLVPAAALLSFVGAALVAGGPGVWRRLGFSID